MAKGESGGVSFELDNPLHFMSGVELMQEIHTQAQTAVGDKTILPCRIAVPRCDSNGPWSMVMVVLVTLMVVMMLVMKMPQVFHHIMQV